MKRQPIKVETLAIPGPVGSLESILEVPETALRKSTIAVVCHPHPLYQGAMTNKVAYTLARVCVALGVPALRFNFRGVGSSEGEYDEGRGETEDALAAVAWMLERFGAKQIWMLGFSFGAGIALKVATSRFVDTLVTVAPPITRMPINENDVSVRRWMLVQGDADEVVDPGPVLTWAKSLREPPRVMVIKGAGHFFHGRLTELKRSLIGVLEEGVDS